MTEVLPTQEDLDVWDFRVNVEEVDHLYDVLYLISTARAADVRDAQIFWQIMRSRLIPVYEASMSGGAHRRVIWWELP